MQKPDHDHHTRPSSDARDIPTVSYRFPNGDLVELLYDRGAKRTALAYCHGGEVTITDTVATSDGAPLIPVPARNNLIAHRAVLLPERPEDFGSVNDLVTAIDRYLYRFVDCSDNFRQLAAHYILLSWVYDAFNELPYLRLRGDYGSGKTRALIVIGSVCYKPFFASGASTVSPIFHTLDTFRGTLILDEADFRMSDAKAELVKILNNGNVRGFPVLRAQLTPQKTFDPRAFTVFGPKVVAMRQSFDDQALESRFLTEAMGAKRLRSDIPINLPARQEEEATHLRNKLLAYRFAMLSSTAVDPALCDATLSPRLNQILLPLLSIVENPGVRDQIREAAHGVERELAVERASTSEAALLAALAELIAEGEQSAIPVADITKRFVERSGSDFDRPITNRYVGYLLRKRLNIATYKTHGVYAVYVPDKTTLDLLCTKYGIASDARQDTKA